MSKPLSFQQRNTNVLKAIVVAGLCALLAYWLFEEFRGPTPLIEGVMSYQSLTQAKAQFDGDLKWKVVEDSGLGAGDTRPRFDILTLSTPYKYHSVSGELTLKFFNDELMSTTFVPSEIMVSARLEALAPNAYQSNNFMEGGFLKWQDKRLEREVNNWVMAYA